jgi:hypothetical protein
MEARYPLAVLAAYGAFFVGVWMWIAYVRSTAPRAILEPALAAPAVAAALAIDPGRPRRQGGSGLESVDLEDVADAPTWPARASAPSATRRAAPTRASPGS